jgi:GrpB-like predicted nucleotidyltransferase (UPF0157 family)
MKTGIVADGRFRWLVTGENDRLRRAVWRVVEARYARRLEGAGFFQYLRLRYLRYRRFRRELAKVTPSTRSLWLGPSAPRPEANLKRSIDPSASRPPAMRLSWSEDLQPVVERVLDQLGSSLRTLVPDFELQHIGATSIRGAVTKGDVDVLLRVTRERFPAIVELLTRHFQIKQPANWSSEFASFGDDDRYALSVGIQVVVIDTTEDAFLFLRDYLLGNPDALEQYNRLKVAAAPAGSEAYWKAKDAFLSGLLTSRTTNGCSAERDVAG